MLIGCSNATDGLWIEKNENALLKFYDDSVIDNSLQTSLFRDTLGYIMTKDSITFTGLNPEMTNGITERTFKYIFKDDSLIIWYRSEERVSYFKTNSENYFEYFLSKGDLKINLPSAENAKPTPSQYGVLNIKIGLKDNKLKLTVQDEEISFHDFDRKIKEFKNQDLFKELWAPEIICQLFIDETVTCEYTFWLTEYLRSNNLRTINFITQTKENNPNTSDFYGLFIILPFNKLKIIEEKMSAKTF